MDADWNITGPASLQFFSKITSTATHELNNYLGIINENAGLLEDLGLMTKQGNPPDTDKWIQICQKIGAQVRRTHETIQSLNNFSHSADYAMTAVNPDNLLSLIVSLSTRILSEKKVTAEFIPSQKPMEIHTRPFLFLQLMGSCLIYARDHAVQDETIFIRTRTDGEKYQISFSEIRKKNDGPFTDQSGQKILEMLGADIEFQTGPDSLIISIGTARKNNN